ncbi:MAG: EamA family transporter [Ignavibacteriae bacterium]|nr:EamA family transporter [Ignavibacteriota bacterium]
MKKAAILAYLLFATSFTPIAARFVVNEISPLSLAFFRFGTANLLLIIIFLIQRHTIKIDKKDITRFIILGLLVLPFNQFFFLKGISLSTAAHSGIMYSLTPLFAYLISIKIKHEKYSHGKLFSILLSIIGIVIIFYENFIESEKSTSMEGDILLILAVTTWAFYLTLSKDMVAKYGAVKTSTIAFTIGSILYIPILIYDLPNFTLDKLSTYGILSFIHLTFLVAFGSYFVFTWSSKYISVSSLTTSMNSSPLITIVFSWILLNEKLSYFFIIGTVITLFGVFWAQRYNDIKINKSAELSSIE